MRSETTIREAVYAIITETCGTDVEITAEKTLDALGMDSLDICEMEIEIESRIDADQAPDDWGWRGDTLVDTVVRDIARAVNVEIGGAS